MTAKITLTHDQKCVMARFLEFINSDVRVFVLTGYAGTGKTTMVQEMLRVLRERRNTYRLLASTGRAAKILQNTSGEEACTVHSMIYKYKGFNQDLQKLVETREKSKVDHTGELLLNFALTTAADDCGTTFYFIDEASMVSDVRPPHPNQAIFGSGRLLNDLLQYDANGKFVFIGDPCQLPPVGQSFSPALSTRYFAGSFGMAAIEATLTEVMRQAKGNDIVLSAAKMRRLYANPQPWKWAKFPMKGFANIHLVHSQLDLVQRYIRQVKSKGYNDSTMICFSNRQCGSVTNVLRPALGMKSPEIEVGDLLLVTQNNMLSGLMNGDLVVVQSIGEKEVRAGLTFVNVSVQELFTKRVCSQKLVADILYSNQTNLSQSEQKELFVDFYIRMRKQGVEQKNPLFDKKLCEDEYLNALRAVWGVALTCHKTQGGEWNNVFLDIPRNLAVQDKPYVYQWMYTAMTRARKELYIVDDFYLM